MNIYLGTYDGFVIVLTGGPTDLSVRACNQISENSIRCLLFSNQEVIVGGYDQQLRAVHPFTAVELKQSKETNGILNCMTKINNNVLAIGLETGGLRFWDVANWNMKKEVKQHKKAIRDIKIQSKKALMISIGGKQMIFWNVTQMKSVYHYKFEHELQHLLVNDDFSKIFIFTEKSIHQINAETNEETHKLQLLEKIQCTALFMNYILIGTEKGEIQIRAIDHYDFKIAFKAHDIRVKALKIINIEEVDYLITASSSGEVAVWDVLQFLKNIENISQDYQLEGLKPIFSIQTKYRIICMDAVSNQQFMAILKQKQTKLQLSETQPISTPIPNKPQHILQKKKKKLTVPTTPESSSQPLIKIKKDKQIKKAKKVKSKLNR